MKSRRFAMGRVCSKEMALKVHVQRFTIREKLLPTGIIILRNYLEIGNALPYRKNGFQEFFGSVIPIKSVMDAWAGIVFF